MPPIMTVWHFWGARVQVQFRSNDRISIKTGCTSSTAGRLALATTKPIRLWQDTTNIQNTNTDTTKIQPDQYQNWVHFFHSWQTGTCHNKTHPTKYNHYNKLFQNPSHKMQPLWKMFSKPIRQNTTITIDILKTHLKLPQLAVAVFQVWSTHKISINCQYW